MFLLHFSRFKTFLFLGHSKIKVRSCVLCIYAGTPLAVLLLWISYVFSVLCLMCICERLFVCALWSPAGKGLLLALVCGVQLWVCPFPIGILGQVWYLIVLIPDLCTLTYFVCSLPKQQAYCELLWPLNAHYPLPVTSKDTCAKCFVGCWPKWRTSGLPGAVNGVVKLFVSHEISTVSNSNIVATFKQQIE